MTRQPIPVLLAPILSAMILPALMLPAFAALAEADDVEQQLASQYQDKVLTLRHFYQGDHLHFQSDGSLIGAAAVGPWTVDGQVSVKSVKLHGNKLQIRGRRVCLVFDTKGKPPRDLLSSLAESQVNDRDKLAESFRNSHVDIEIALNSKPDLDEATSAMNAVFLKPDESVADIVPDYWRDYFDKQEGRTRPVAEPPDPVYKIKRGEVSAPRLIFQPPVEFSDEARRAKYQGEVTLSLVVGSSGSARDLQITSPLGLGLDEKAIEAVRTWTFQPALRNGKPVSVQIAVEVSFHLY